MKKNLDYTDSNNVVNFRDGGDFINLISNEFVIRPGRLLRGGTVKAVKDRRVIGNPKTIFNLQKGPDPEFEGITNYHFPISNDYEKYETRTPEVRQWLNRILRVVESGIEYPLYVHCLSGRDRTGVVVAALWKILGVEESHIVEEYYLSTGTEGRDHIYTAVRGIRDPKEYFRRVDLDVVRASLLGS